MTNRQHNKDGKDADSEVKDVIVKWFGTPAGAFIGPIAGVLVEAILLHSVRWDSHLLWYSAGGAILGVAFPRAATTIFKVVVDSIQF